jgi:AcrR family transcriptional regulator
MTKKKSPEVRREQILAAAITLAARTNYATVTRKQIADHCGIAEGLVSKYLGTMIELRRTLMRTAVHDAPTNPHARRIVAQGLTAGDKHARKASDLVKNLAMVEAAQS